MGALGEDTMLTMGSDSPVIDYEDAWRARIDKKAGPPKSTGEAHAHPHLLDAPIFTAALQREIAFALCNLISSFTIHVMYIKHEILSALLLSVWFIPWSCPPSLTL